MNKIIVEESAKEVAKESAEEGEEANPNTAMGSISFVSCATGEDSVDPQSLGVQEEGENVFIVVIQLLLTCRVILILEF